MICVNQENTHFICLKYTSGGNKVSGSEKRCDSIEELKDFLLSMPSAPQSFIFDFIDKLNNSQK